MYANTNPPSTLGVLALKYVLGMTKKTQGSTLGPNKVVCLLICASIVFGSGRRKDSTFTYSIAWLTGIAVLNPSQTADAFSRFFGLGPLARPFGIGLYFLVVATIGVIQNCATTLGEEIGWRGFLVPELAKHFSFTATAILSGVIWALWHVPIIVFAGYDMGTGWYGLAVVSANMIGLCFVLTWLRLKSGSLWTGVILHASSNHFIQQFFDPMTAYTRRTKYILGEFGIGFTLVVAVLAAYFWMRRAEVVQPQ